MRCNHALELISRRVDNELTFEERESLLEHLRACKSCNDASCAYEEDAFRIRRILRFFRPKKAEFIRRTLALITEREEPHREVAPMDERTSRSTWWLRVAAFALPVAAGVLVVASYWILAPIRTEELQSLKADVSRLLDDNNRLTQMIHDASRKREAPLGSAPALSPRIPESGAAPGSVAGAREDETAKPVAGASNSATADPLTAVQKSMQDLLDALKRDELTREELTRAMTIAKQIGDQVLEVSSLSTQLAERLTQILKRPDLGVEDQIALSSILAKIQSPDAADYFRNQLLNSDPVTRNNIDLRRVLAEGLASNADNQRDTQDLLLSLMNGAKEDYQVRFSAAQGLIRIAEEVGTSDLFDSVKALAMEEAADSRLRLQIVNLLAGNPLTPNVVEFLTAIAMSNGDHDERQAAIDGLAKLPSAEASAALEALSNNHEMPSDLQNRARRNRDRAHDNSQRSPR